MVTMTNHGRRSRVTLADVARDCGMDKSTISKALNLPPDQFALTPATRQRIMEAVKRLNYRPSVRAQALARGETRVVGLVYDESTPPSGIYIGVQYALSVRLREEGYSLEFYGIGRDHDRWADLLGGQQVDAVVAISRLPDEFGEMIVRQGVPAVLMNLDVDLPIDQVRVDDEAGMDLAVRHLLDLGHRRIGFYNDASTDPGVPSHYSYELRRRRFHGVMRDAGLEPTDVLGAADQTTTELVGHLLGLNLTGVVAYSHPSAICLLHELWRQGRSVPDDMSVVSFNEVFPVSVTIPPLTTVTTVGPQMGEVAGDLLMRTLRRSRRGAEVQPGDDAGPRRVYLPERLIVRGSTAPPKADGR